MTKRFAVSAAGLCCAAAFLLFSCQPGDGTKQKPMDKLSETSKRPGEEQVLLDTFADLQILRYELPGWEKLDLRQKTLIYYLAEATLAGRDIIYDQHCRTRAACPGCGATPA